jgi:hypothetical protein
LLALAVVVLVARWSHGVQWASLFVALAFVHSRWLAWRFTVSADGVGLVFPFGRRRFLARDDVNVRIELVGSVLRVRGRVLRYLLLDGILYRPGNAEEMRSAFARFGFRIDN